MKIASVTQLALLSFILTACGGDSSSDEGSERTTGETPTSDENDQPNDGDSTPDADDSNSSGSGSDNDDGAGNTDDSDDGAGSGIGGNTEGDSGSGDSGSVDSGGNPDADNNTGSDDNAGSDDSDSNTDDSDDNADSDDNSGADDSAGSGDNTDADDNSSGSDDSAGDDSNSDDPTLACLPEWGQEMLDSINQYRSQARQCGDDFMPAVEPLTWQCQLTTSSQAHADDMATNNFFSHTGSDGLSMRNRIDATGYQWSRIGENIAAGYANVSSVMQGWINSPGHCSNIMNADFTEVGVALTRTTTADYPTYWVQNFGRPR
jgi:uncharacterized protein YkwD